MEEVAELPVRIGTHRRSRIVIKLRDDAYIMRLMRAATGDHVCRPLDVPRETLRPFDLRSTVL